MTTMTCHRLDRHIAAAVTGRSMLAALKRLVNGYSVSPAKLIMDDDDDQSVDMDELVFRPNPVERLEISNSDDVTRSD